MNVGGHEVGEELGFALDELWFGGGRVLAASQVCIFNGFGWWVKVKVFPQGIPHSGQIGCLASHAKIVNVNRKKNLHGSVNKKAFPTWDFGETCS